MKENMAQKKGRIEIKKNATVSKKLLKSDQGFSYSPIDLKATKSLGKRIRVR